MARAYSVLNETALLLLLWHVIGMRMRDLTLKQLTAVPCPTCGVAPGKRCLLHSGAPRSGPHVDRKLSAAEAIETKRIPLPANNPLCALVSPVTSSDVEVRSFPMSAKVGA